MKIIKIADTNTVINQYVAELRDIHVQSDRNTFRHNLQRIGQMMAYEVSKTLSYSEKEIQTPLALAKANTPDDEIVLATVFRAGLPFHQGFLDVFDHAGNAFVMVVFAGAIDKIGLITHNAIFQQKNSDFVRISLLEIQFHPNIQSLPIKV